MAQKIDNALYLGAFAELNNSTRNLRYQMVVLGVASILVFSAFYNSVKFGWFNSRIAVTERMIEWYDCIIIDSLPKGLSSEEKTMFQECVNRQKKMPISMDQLETNLGQYQERKLDNIVLIKVPFLGICFDINDLSLLSGIGFVLILFLVFYALLQRYHQIRTAFTLISFLDISEKDQAYLTLATNQILSLRKESLKGHAITRYLPRAFYVIPVLLYAAIVIHDIWTFNVASIILMSPLKGIVSIVVSMGFLIILSILSLYCWRIVQKTDLLWNNHFPTRLIDMLNTENIALGE